MIERERQRPPLCPQRGTFGCGAKSVASGQKGTYVRGWSITLDRDNLSILRIVIYSTKGLKRDLQEGGTACCCVRSQSENIEVRSVASSLRPDSLLLDDHAE